jgi:signal transduction histidine kinase
VKGRPAAAADGDARLVRRAALLVAAQTAVAVAIVVAVVAALALSLTVREQKRSSEGLLKDAANDRKSFTHAPSGITMIGRYPDGKVVTSAGAIDELTSLDIAKLPSGYSKRTFPGVGEFQLYVCDPPDRRVVAALDLSVPAKESNRLLNALLIAGAVGIAAAAAVGWLIARRAVRPLGTALALQRRFVADASHELRTPLTILHTRAQLLRRRAGPDPAMRQNLDRLIADTRALTEIVNDLLLSTEMRHRPDARESVDLAELARDVADGFGPAAEEAGIRLVVEVPPDQHTAVAGVPAALRRAISALVDNALGHNHAGGTVTLSVTDHGSTVELAVIDDGEGLDPGEATKLTERFARGTDAPGRGRRFGLGLALVREVVQAHGGTLRLDGQPGLGATATISVPAG